MSRLKRHLFAFAVGALLYGWWYGTLLLTVSFLLAGADRMAELVIAGGALALGYGLTYRKRKP